MAKTIVFLADGTWNCPDQDQDEDGSPDRTNVYKMFLALDGVDPVGAFKSTREHEKEVRNDGVSQIANYIHGVGYSTNPSRVDHT